MPEEYTIDKMTGSGVTASISTDGTTYSQFASVTSITPPNMTRATVDVTDLNSYSNNDQFKEFLSSFIEGEEIQISGFFRAADAGRAAAETAFYAGTSCYIKLYFPAPVNKDWVCRGVPTSYQQVGEITADAGIPFRFGVKPTAKPTMTAHSAE